jgi:thiamine-monophosphate kinase
MRETEIVAKIRRAASATARSEIVKGIGDDCAVVRPRANEDLVFTTDFVLEGRHFTLDTHKPAEVGHKALARSLSDLAAMGSDPVFCLVSLALPATVAANWIDRFYRGLLALAAKYRVALAGGDLARFPSVVADVICCGRVPRGKALTRNGARGNDLIYVTGELGGSAHGFASRKGASWRRHIAPEPRIDAGIALRRLGISACMDLSDGLSLDLRRLCLESGISAELDGTLPVARGATLENALHGGEDYELLFTAPPSRRVPSSVAGVKITRIGHAASSKPGRVRLHGRVIEPKGYDHFA